MGADSRYVLAGPARHGNMRLRKLSRHLVASDASFETVEQLRLALLDFCQTYNTTWLIERHGFRPPAAIPRINFHPRPSPHRVTSRVPETAGGTSLKQPGHGREPWSSLPY